MEVERLKGLAAHLRVMLEEDGTTVSHGQALDLIAAVVGLRSWPEVTAFPDRVAACSFDTPAAERLAKRCARRHGSQWLAGMWHHMLEMAEFHAATPIRHGTERLIVATCSSGAGHLMASRIADKIVDVPDSLVWGPVPAAADPIAFFHAREAAYADDPGYRDPLHEWDRDAPPPTKWAQLLAACRTYERVELWIDPTPNEQLLFIQLLEGLGRHADIVERIFIVHADDRLGESSAQKIAAMNPTFVKAGPAQIDVARKAWAAYGQPSPTAWFDLLHDDLEALPYLRRTVRLLLAELPALDTALGATEQSMLRTVAPGGVTFELLMRATTVDRSRRVFGYWEDGRILDGLGRCAAPAVLGVPDGPFDMVLHMDKARFDAYRQMRLSLSDLGRRLHERTDDFAHHNVIHRWWGGTLLTNDRLWRWDAGTDRLIAPR